jgi:hypothetical protein
VVELTLPDRHRGAIVSILKLSADEGSRLLKQLADCDSKNATMIALFDGVVGNGREVLRGLVTFAVIPRRFGMTANELDAAVKRSFDMPESEFPLGELLTSAPVQQAAKALDLRNAYERILLTSRIVSDIRPVFDDDDIKESVTAAMVNHTLQLKYSGSAHDQQDLHIAVDIDDLKRLREQIDRALKKEAAARSFIEKGDAVLLEALESSGPVASE